MNVVVYNTITIAPTMDMLSLPLKPIHIGKLEQNKNRSNQHTIHIGGQLIIITYMYTNSAHFHQVTIPEDDTTYWCTAFKLPEGVRNKTKYVTKVHMHSYS